MRRVMLMVFVWIGLFAATLGGRVLATRSDTTNVAEAKAVSAASEQSAEEALAELRSKPRRNAFSIDENAESEAVERAVSACIRGHDSGLRQCRSIIMKRPTRASEYFEVSFEPHVAGSVVHLDKVELERSTLLLTKADEDCIVAEFKKIELPMQQTAVRRVAHLFCFRALDPDKL
jgi:hypothetical protein